MSNSSSGSRLPIGVLLPVFNCRNYLPHHLAAMRDWAGLVEEIVVVDSHSEDGTLELLKAELRLPHVRFLSHPRGLYQSWNFGLRQITAKYTYVSTVGDVITRAGLEHLLAVAEQFQSDVVVSPPRIVDLKDQPLKDWIWPIHRLIDWNLIARPAELSSVEAFLTSAMLIPQGVLGSSASNLYRTAALHGRPFPTEYGGMGDTAWALRYALETRFAITPLGCSRFVVHPKAGGPNDEQVARIVEALAQIALTTWTTHGMIVHFPLLELLRSLQTSRIAYRDSQTQYDASRERFWPWILNPQAWGMRSRRNQQRARLQAVNAAIRSQIVSVRDATAATHSQGH